LNPKYIQSVAEAANEEDDWKSLRRWWNYTILKDCGQFCCECSSR
jgi:hypothetical protein